MRAIHRWKTSSCLLVAVLALLIMAGQTLADAGKSATSQPAAKKPEVGPPGAKHTGAHGVAPQPTGQQPTVQLKPGEVPGIVFDTPEYNFGRIPAGQDIAHDFWFTNTGNGPLEILKAQPS